MLGWIFVSFYCQRENHKESAGSELDVHPTSDLGWSELQPLTSKLPTVGKIMPGQQSTSKALVSKKVVNVGGGENQQTTETREYSVKGSTHSSISFLKRLY